jgi:hypothetical protein
MISTFCDWDRRDVAVAKLRAALWRMQRREAQQVPPGRQAEPSTPMPVSEARDQIEMPPDVMLVDVKIPNGSSATIEVHRGDSPTQLASAFGKLHHLTPKQTKRLRDAIAQASQGMEN